MDLLRSLPIGLYLEQPVTWLHRLDSRVKLAWLMSFLIAPVLASSGVRLALVGLLMTLTLSAMIPVRVWRQQLGWLTVLMLMVFGLTMIAPDGIAASQQPRLPADELALAQQTVPPPSPQHSAWYNPLSWGQRNSPLAATTPELPQPTAYRYVLVKHPPITITRQSLDLAIRVSTLIFTLIYSTTLYLLTTAPEEITAGLDSLLHPLRRLHLPVTEIILTLTLALRFIPLVLEEVQNLARSIQTRAINWRKLGFRGTSQIWLLAAERLLENLLRRAEQIASAMLIRGFTTPSQHYVQWHPLRICWQDWVAMAALVLLWGVRLVWGWQS
ncbi:MAG: energy-coupling factor transporter transmembrane protein EcfT [Cyanobacteria bacterium]|nr:energy-coupling factor transporter transmembrane protein EcfT [Cyanobacteriota bacterium]MDW8202021.1 energy-coupling factor transporter transmembrane protein EcfT [Cyanobacteriota bacterium SKYGB_h_bin112]